MSTICELPSYLEDLNPPQLEAVKHVRGPILVLAGAGSGKTRVLTKRILHLVLGHGVAPRRILAVTFTNKATEEMRERLTKFLGPRADELWVSTFHSAALRILRRHASLLGYKNDFVIYDDQDSHGLLKSIIREAGIDEKRYPPSMFARIIDQAKNAFILPDEFRKNAKDYAAKIQGDIYDRYQAGLMRANAMDFGDLLVNVVRLFKEHPRVLATYQQGLEFVLVDEFQDTNTVQYDFVRMITGAYRNLLVVGDDDQSIYRFRGATIRNILEFERDFPDAKVVTLEQNYRSTANVLAAAHSVISRNTGRKPKQLWTAGPPGAKITTCLGLDEGDEAAFVAHEISLLRREGISYRDIAIFYRTNAQSRALEEALMNARIPYRIFGGMRFYDRKEIRDILGYLRLLLNDRDDQAFLRVVNTPARGIGAQSVKSLIDAASANGESLLQCARRLRVDGSRGARGGALDAFVSLMDTLEELSQKAPLSELIAEVIKSSEYEKRLKAAKDPQSESRIENLRELEAIGRSMELGDEAPRETLRRFMDRVSLASSADLPTTDESGAPLADVGTVSMMTLHLAKGLEFSVVFFTGIEEGLIPHQRSMFDPDELEEERRLCYVGITRAKEKLYFTRAVTRGFTSAGGGGYREVSRFVRDIEGELLEHRGSDFIGGGSVFSYGQLDDRDSDDRDPEDRDSEDRDEKFADGQRIGGQRTVGQRTGSLAIGARGPGFSPSGSTGSSSSEAGLSASAHRPASFIRRRSGSIDTLVCPADALTKGTREK